MRRIFEREDMRNARRVFEDRSEAGRVLGGMLAPDYGGTADLILLGIPMGGVPVALEVAAMLGCGMDLVIVRKIQIPGNTEAGFGAMTEEGEVFLNKPLMAYLRLTDEEIERQSAKVREELAERSRRLRGGHGFPQLAGKTVILVDDGLASGFTMKAAIHTVRRRKASATLVAVPTASLRIVDALAETVDAVYCANIREVSSFAVADAYKNWHDLDEAQVLDMLARASSGPDATGDGQ